MRCEQMAIELGMVSQDCAAHVVHHFDHRLGYQPGNFVDHLIKAFVSADPLNKRLLGRGFPEYRLAIHLAQDHALGMDTLRAIAEKENA